MDPNGTGSDGVEVCVAVAVAVEVEMEEPRDLVRLSTVSMRPVDEVSGREERGR